MYRLSHKQFEDLFDAVMDQVGKAPTLRRFSDALFDLCEDIPGLETMTIHESAQLINQLWNKFMSKNPSSAESVVQPAGSVTVDLSKPVLKKAIAEGKALIAEGKTKADAARAMYQQISNESKETIVAAFIEGATLTPKGAQTYWYNCRRRASKEKKTVQ